MSDVMTGRAHVYPRADINTDEIIPARYLMVDDEAELARHAMEDIDPAFGAKVQPGDFVVAGANFGCGSSREHALWALRGAGVAAVIAESYSRIFLRNAINNGYLALEVAGIATAVEDGARLEVRPAEGLVRDLDSGREYRFAQLPEFALEIRRHGHLLDYLRAREAAEERR